MIVWRPRMVPTYAISIRYCKCGGVRSENSVIAFRSRGCSAVVIGNRALIRIVWRRGAVEE
jgi:hypothetical protein